MEFKRNTKVIARWQRQPDLAATLMSSSARESIDPFFRRVTISHSYNVLSLKGRPASIFVSSPAGLIKLILWQNLDYTAVPTRFDILNQYSAQSIKRMFSQQGVDEARPKSNRWRTARSKQLHWSQRRGRRYLRI